MSKVIVTGGNGFIGGHIVDRLVADGHEVHIIDDLSAELNDFVYNSSAEYHQIDIGSPDLMGLDFVFRGAEHVFHLAAESRIQPAIKDPKKAHTTNAIGTLNVLQMSLKHGIKKVLYSSTSSVYENLDDESGSTDESTRITCLNPYSLSKLFGEELCRYYSNVHGIETIVFRYFNVFGERSPNKGAYAPVIGIFLNQLHKGLPLTVVGDGGQRRDFVHVSDVVQANLLAMNLDISTRGLPINIGTGTNISISEIARIFLSVHSNLIIEHIPAREGEVRHTRASIQRARNTLGFQPSITVEDWVLAQIQ